MKTNYDKSNILAIIKGRNKETPLSVEALSGISHVPERVCKRYVQELRLEGERIAGDENGYFYAQSPDDLNHAIAIIKSHIHSRQLTIEALERTRLALLLDGQMERLL